MDKEKLMLPERKWEVSEPRPQKNEREWNSVQVEVLALGVEERQWIQAEVGVG